MKYVTGQRGIGGRGGGGGGGGGGNGGNLFLEYFADNSSITVNNSFGYGGIGGYGGSYGGNGNNGKAGQIIRNRIEYNPEFVERPKYFKNFLTEKNRIYRLKGELKQPLESNIISAGLIRIFDEFSNEIKSVSIFNDKTYSSIFFDSSPKREIIKSGETKQLFIMNRDEFLTAKNCSKSFLSYRDLLGRSINEKLSNCLNISDSCPTDMPPLTKCSVSISYSGTCLDRAVEYTYLKKECDSIRYNNYASATKKETLISIPIKIINNVSEYNYSDLPENKYTSFAPANNRSRIYKDFIEGYRNNNFRSCNDIWKNIENVTSGVYLIDPDGDGGLAPFNVYCNFDIFGGGWTLAMKLGLNDSPFDYGSIHWTSDSVYNEKDYSLDPKISMKNQSFNKIKGKEFLFCMSSVENCILVTSPTPVSLKDIFNGTVKIGTTRSALIKLVGTSSRLQPYCNAISSNISLGSGSYNKRCRFGILSNQENDCGTPDSFIGFGCGGSQVPIVQSGAACGGSWNCSPGVDYRAGFIFVRDASLNEPPLYIDSRIHFDFIFTAQSAKTKIEISSLNREIPTEFDNIEMFEISSENGSGFPVKSQPDGSVLANYTGKEFPGYFELDTNPAIKYTDPSYDKNGYKVPENSLWNINYVSIGARCPLFYKKISKNIVQSHNVYSEDSFCSDVSYKYDPDNLLIDWVNSGVDRKPEFGQETIKCSPKGCSVRSSISKSNKYFSEINLQNSAAGTLGGSSNIFIYDTNNFSTSNDNGSSGNIGINDLPNLTESRMCVKIQDASNNDANSEFSKSPQVDFKEFNWSAISVNSSNKIQQPVKENKPINLYKKIDSSVRHLLFSELF